MIFFLKTIMQKDLLQRGHAEMRNAERTKSDVVVLQLGFGGNDLFVLHRANDLSNYGNPFPVATDETGKHGIKQGEFFFHS